eukprot:TRINITY_DN9081_c0_g1_i1.p1 TRINITY_DN9081_c0_g1~~TRINITY_DN9081_c0_g1_i1.p1  ORF type:complete len:283 (-),score=26.98 TRINITY_DN9081_c0_g1_i1:328-1176(-)
MSDVQADGAAHEELVRVETRRLNHEAVRENLAQALQVTIGHCGRCWCFLIMGMLLIGVYLVAWSENMYDRHSGDECDTPLALMLRLLYFIAMINIFQKEIIRCFCCYDLSRDGPIEPLRIKIFKRTTWLLSLAWPLAGGIMLTMTKKCSSELVDAMRTLLGYYLAVFVVAIVLPAVSITIALWLIRRGWISVPRSREAAPENFIEELPTVEYVEEIFDDNRPGGFPSSCAICLDGFNSEKAITKTPCNSGSGHAFHTECLRGWLQVSRTCPLCRVDMTEAAA